MIISQARRGLAMENTTTKISVNTDANIYISLILDIKV